MDDDDVRTEDRQLRRSTGMGSGYEIRPSPIGRPSRRTPRIVLAATALFLGLVMAKPWAAQTAPPSVTQAVVSDPAPVPSRAIARPVATSAAPVIGSLATHSGTWGVGSAGFGPRYDGEPWVDWAAVDPQPTTEAPSRIAMRPGTGICAGLPVLVDRPLFIAVTNPVDVPADRRLVGWWSDGARTASLADAVRQVTPVGDYGISYLVRLDREPWPAGRYEFHVVAGDRAVALTVCLARTG